MQCFGVVWVLLVLVLVIRHRIDPNPFASLPG
jgi:hypothetical protein